MFFVVKDEPKGRLLGNLDFRPPVNPNEPLFGLFTSKWGSKRLLYNTEMDGIASDIAYNFANKKSYDVKTFNFVQAKAVFERNRENISRPADWGTYYQQWWCAARLSKISTIYRGLYNQANQLYRITPLETTEIRRLVGVSIF